MMQNYVLVFLCKQEAQVLGKEDETRLLKSRQLVLLVDLDQTLIHTTNDNIPNNLKVSFLQLFRDFNQKPEIHFLVLKLKTGSILLATGFHIFLFSSRKLRSE